MGERMWPKLRVLTMILTFLSWRAMRFRIATVLSRGGIVDEDVLVAVASSRSRSLPHPLVEFAHVVFFVVARRDHADGSFHGALTLWRRTALKSYMSYSVINSLLSRSFPSRICTAISCCAEGVGRNQDRLSPVLPFHTALELGCPCSCRP